MDAPKLPTEIKEQATAKTSVYRQGHLVYDGATGEYVGDEHGEAGKRHGIGPGTSLNEMLKWSIENSDPAELARRAGDREVKPPSQVDREILDMLLGEPIVAKMRECLGKLDGAQLRSLDGLDAACAALEELEYYAEDLDHAMDLAKIGGLQVLKRCCAFGLLEGADLSDEAAAEAKLAAEHADDAAALREAACGVMAAALQNNPKVERAASAAGVQTLLLAMLSGGGVGASAERVGGVAVVRKALLALSALLRTCVDDPGEDAEAPKERKIDLTDPDAVASAAAEAAAEAAEASSTRVAAKLAAVEAALPTLSLLSAHPDLKVRRRAIFLLACLATAMPAAGTAIAAVAAARVASAADGDGASAGQSSAPPLLRGLLGSLVDEDEDLRTQSQRLLLAVRGLQQTDGGEVAALLATRLGECDGVRVLRTALQKAGEAAAGGESDPEESSRLRQLLEWAEKA
jgi:hypothetical protein